MISTTILELISIVLKEYLLQIYIEYFLSMYQAHDMRNHHDNTLF